MEDLFRTNLVKALQSFEKKLKVGSKFKNVKHDDLQVLYDFALKHYNKEMIGGRSYQFENAFTQAAMEMGESEGYTNLSSDEKKNVRSELIAHGQLLDLFIELSNDKHYDAMVMRSSLAKAMGSYLYMLHNGNMKDIEADLRTMAGVAKKSAEEFGASVKGWETMVKRA